MESVLRPRDIQARIRSGESPETVAEAARTTVDAIMGFATPVLAERAYIAQQALKASVRRRAGDGTIGHLGEAVEQRLATRDVDPDSVSWDSWRREDGRWTLVAAYPSGGGLGAGTTAKFIYDAAGRYVMADDDEARWLVGERASTAAAPTQTVTEAPTEHATPEHDTVVETIFEGDEPRTEQLPLGDDAIEVVTGLRPAAEPLATDDWMLTQASERTAPRPTPAAPAASRRSVEEEPAETLFDTPVPDEPSPASDDVVEPEQATSGDQETSQETSQVEPAKPKKSSKSKRASVPSWDEIMFGSGKGD